MYKMFRNGWAKHIDFMLWDLVCSEAAFLLAFFIYLPDIPEEVSATLYRDTTLVLIVSSILVAAFSHTYHDILRRGYLKEMTSVIGHVVKVWILVFFIMFILKFGSGDAFSRIVFLLSFFFDIGLTYGVRLWWKKKVVRRLKATFNRAFLIVCDESGVKDIIDHFKENNFYGIDIIGLVIWDKSMTSKKILGYEVVADSVSAVDYICHNHVDEVFIHVESQRIPSSFIHSCIQMGLPVHRPVTNTFHTKQILQKLVGYTTLTSAINIMGPRELFVKRICDILGALVGVAITGIILPFVAVAIKRKSPGPIFFKQERVGQNGKTFKMYKFRTMYVNADSDKTKLMAENEMNDGMMFKMENDPRIIPGVGTFLRHHSIDEFPQFFNVLKGEMSLVGTRPPTIEEWNKYLPNHRVRLAVRPGITGMWQVSGRNEVKDFEEVVKLDEIYINEWSYSLDVKIVFKTISGMFKGSGL